MADPMTAINAAMNNDITQMNTISQNLANVNTQGYKREVMTLKSFDQVMQNSGAENSTDSVLAETLPETKPVYDFQQGTMKYTGSNFDIALEGKGFLSVLGLNNKEMYCRKGALRIDNQGRLTLVSGEPILGQSGQIHLNMAPFSINKQGEILQDGIVADRLKLTEFADSKNIESHGHGLYLLASQTSSEANAPGAKASDSTKVMQGYLEISNVNMMDEMVNMINVTRHFEASSKVLQGYDGMMDSAINVIGDL